MKYFVISYHCVHARKHAHTQTHARTHAHTHTRVQGAKWVLVTAHLQLGTQLISS